MRYVPGVLSVLPLLLALAPAGLPALHHGPASPPFAIGLEGAALVPFGDVAAAPSSIEEGLSALLTLRHAPEGSRFFAIGLELGGAALDATVPGAPGGAVRALRAGLGGSLAIPGRGGGPFALELTLGLGLLRPVAAAESPELPFLRATLYGAPAAKLLVRLDEGLELSVGAELLVAPGAVDHPDRQKELWLTAGPVAGLRLWI